MVCVQLENHIVCAVRVHVLVGLYAVDEPCLDRSGLSVYGKGKGQGDKAIKPETPDDETSIKDEDEDEDRGGLSRFPPDNDSEEENARPEPASTSETEDASHARDIGHGGMGTGVESAGDRGVQRRRSRMFEGEQS